LFSEGPVSYLTVDQFKDRTTLPEDVIDALEAARPGWVLVQLNLESRRLDARLAKRYVVPFVDPAPEIILAWITDIVTMRCWSRRGFDPTTQDMQPTIDAATKAAEEIAEAAEAETGLFELPLRQDTTADGVSKGAPRAYTEASPYVWTTVQAGDARDEDRNGGGTFR
jgi:hypothetical protein